MLLSSSVPPVIGAREASGGVWALRRRRRGRASASTAANSDREGHVYGSGRGPHVTSRRRSTSPESRRKPAMYPKRTMSACSPPT
jgi:hypothetical protein